MQAEIDEQRNTDNCQKQPEPGGRRGTDCASPHSEETNLTVTLISGF